MTFHGYRVSILLKLFANLVACVQFSKKITLESMSFYVQWLQSYQRIEVVGAVMSLSQGKSTGSG